MSRATSFLNLTIEVGQSGASDRRRYWSLHSRPRVVSWNAQRGMVGAAQQLADTLQDISLLEYALYIWEEEGGSILN